MKRILTVIDEQPGWFIAVELVALALVIGLLFAGVLPAPPLA